MILLDTNVSKEDSIDLAVIASRYTRLPNPEIVAKFPTEVFPVIRRNAVVEANHRSNSATQSDIKDLRGFETVWKGNRVVMDDNALARAALILSHGLEKKVSKSFWRLCHIWPLSQEVSAFTNLRNMCLLAAPMTTLSDEGGPLQDCLKYHAQENYGFSPENKVAKPDGYDDMKWQYLPANGDPISLIREKLEETRNRSLLSIKKIGWPHWSDAEGTTQ